MLESFETPRKIRPKCLKCLQAMGRAQSSLHLDGESSYLDSWRAIREIVEQTLAGDMARWLQWTSVYNPQQVTLSDSQLPYAVDILLEVSIILSVTHLPDSHDAYTRNWTRCKPHDLRNPGVKRTTY